MSLSTSPRHSSTPQIIDLTFLSETEEASLRAVLEEDLKLQRAEEARLKSLRDTITREASKFSSTRPGNQCTRCGTRFGWIFNTGALCPTCSERVCKRDRLYDSYAHTWMCSLCDMRMQLHTSEEVLSRSYGPSNILRLSFRERKNKAKTQEVEKLQNRHQPIVQPPPVVQPPPASHDHPVQQNKPPVTKETMPLTTNTTATAPVTEQPAEKPEESIPRSSAVISKSNQSPDLHQSLPVLSKRRTPTPVENPPAKILGITEPLPQPPQPNIIIYTSDQVAEETEQREPAEKKPQQHDSVDKATVNTLVAPYPPGVVVKSNPDIPIQGSVYIKAYTKNNKRLVVKMDKAEGLAAADYGKTSDPFALAYILPDHRRVTKKKTRVELRTVNPVWDTYWEFATKEDEGYKGKVLWISIWDWNRFTKSEFLGEVMLPLWTLNLSDKSTRRYLLQPEQSVQQTAGDLKLSLRYEPPGLDDDDDGKKKKKKPKEGQLHVRIQEAQGLFYDDSYVKCFLRPGKLRAHAHKETDIITKPKCPIYDQGFVFEKVTLETLSTDHVLEITMWDAKFSAQPMGVLRLGPRPNQNSKPWMDSQGDEVTHWEAMIANPNEWAELWHSLRPDADFRKILESNNPSESTGLADSYELLRSSPETQSSDNDLDAQPRQRSHSLGHGPAPKAVLVYPGSDASSSDVSSSATFPRPVEKNPLKLDDQELNALTKENTILNRGNVTTSTTSVTDTPMKKQVSLLISEEVVDKSNEDNEVLSTSGGFTNSLTVRSDYSDMESVYSISVTKAETEITGEIQLALSYADSENTLNVSINKIRGLTVPKDGSENSTNPYVKTYLLPDRSKTTKKKTGVKKGIDPIFNEVLKYPVKRHHLSKHTLLVGVWHNDFWKHNQFLGEVTIPLDKVDWSNPSDKWYRLGESTQDSTQQTSRGELKISLQFNMTDAGKQRGNLEVTVISAHGLLQTEKSCNPVVKWMNSWFKYGRMQGKIPSCHLLPDYKKKFKTKVFKDSTSPQWNEKFIFEKLKLEELRSSRVVELTVWDLVKNKQYDFIGGLRIGPRPRHDTNMPYMDSSETELVHWMEILNTPGKCVDESHKLRQNMNPRTVTIATSEPSGEVNNETGGNEEVTTNQTIVTVGSTTLQDDVMATIPNESSPLPPAAMVTEQPSITINANRTPSPDTRAGNRGNEYSPVRMQRLPDDDDTASTPSHQPKMAQLPVSPSMDSITSAASVYSQADGGKGQYDITGSLLLAVHHSGNRLAVNVKEAKDIVGVNSNKLSNSYVKLYLLPDPTKETKKKTRTVRKSVNPVFNEEFTYNGSLSNMQGRTLQVSVWNRDRFGHNKFLGEVRLQLAEMGLSDNSHRWYALEEMADEDMPRYVGDIRVMLQFVPDQDKKGKKKGKGTLIVWIQQARQLPIIRSGATFVQCNLLPRGKSERFKSDIIQGNSDPTYNIKFRFEKVTDVELSYDRALEITLWEPYRSTNEFIGGIRLGPKPQQSSGGAKEWMDSMGSEVSQWELMTARPEQWADEWHTLRSSMKPREIPY